MSLLKVISKTKSLIFPSDKLMIGMIIFLFSCGVFANPVLDAAGVSSGQATIYNNSATNTTTIEQHTQKAIINWQSFNIGAHETTAFQQPAGGIALNRINPSQGVSQIYGRLTATGQIILVNPAGIFFGPGSFVNVGGLIATTANITDQDFLDGYYRFANSPDYNGAIVNQGQLIAADNGLIALVGGAVSNDGYIQANVGHVVLASGDSFTMSFGSDGLIGFTVDSGVSRRATDKDGHELTNGVSNTGGIVANGGRIIISAKDAAGVLDNVINMRGIAQARSVRDGAHRGDGEIIISGGRTKGVVRIAGKLDASSNILQGGNITVTGHNILLTADAFLDVHGETGGGNVNIGGSAQGQGPLPNAEAVVTMLGAKIDANAIRTGNGGQIVLWSDAYTKVNGSLSATGGSQSGNGGLIETSSKKVLSIGDININTSAANGETGTWLLDPTNIYIASSQGNATTAGMVGTDSSADTGSSPFEASGAVDDSLVLTGTLQTALASSNILVTTNNPSGTGVGNITVVNPVSWASANTLTLTAANDVNINAAITGLAVGSGLTINAGGDIDFNDSVSATTLNVTSGGSTYFNTTNTIGFANANFNSPIVVLQNANLTNGNVNFFGTINGSAGLTVDTGLFTTVTYHDAIGNITPLSYLYTRASAGIINYNSSLNVVGALTTITRDNIPAPGTSVYFNGAPGTTVTAGSINVDAQQGIFINGYTINTTGNQVYSTSAGASTPITITNGDVTLDSSGGSISITGTTSNAIQSDATPRNLIINSSTGTTITNLTIGATNAFNTLTVNGLLTLAGTSNSITTVGDQAYNNGVTMTSSPLLRSTGGGSITFGTNLVAGAVNGSGSLSINTGVGTPGDVTFWGAVGNTTALGSLTVDGNTAINGGSVRTTGIQNYNSNVTLGADTTMTTTNNAINFNSIIDGDRALTLATGTGTVTFSNAVTLGQLTSITKTGTGATNIFGDSMATTGNQSYGGILGLNFAGDTTFTSTTGSISSSGITGNGYNIILDSDSGVGVISGVISNLINLTKNGAGTIALTANGNSYSGNSIINAGTLQIGHGGTTGSVGLGSILNSSNLTFDLTNTKIVSENITGTGSVTQNGSGTLIFDADQDYTGGTIINAGTLQIGNGGTAGNVGLGGVLNSSNLVFNLTGTKLISANISGAGSVTKDGSGTVIFDADQSYTSDTTINAGTLQLGNGGTTGALSSGNVINNGTLAFNRSDLMIFNNDISGSGILTKLGSNILLLGGNNSYTGATNINEGVLEVRNVNAFGTAGTHTSLITVASGAQLALDNYSLAAAAPLVLNGTGIDLAGALYQSNGGSGATFGGAITLGSDSTIGELRGLALTGNIDTAGFTLTLDNNNGIAVSGNISGSGNVIITDIITDPFTSFSGNNTYTGSTTVLKGRLRLLSANALGDGVLNTSSVTVADGASLEISDITLLAAPTLTLNGQGFGNQGALLASAGTGTATYSGDIILGSNSKINVYAGGNLVLSSTNDLTGSGFTLQLAGDGNGSLAANIATATGGVTKTDGGTWTLTGNNTYSGNTTINSGTLQIGDGGSAGQIGTGNIINNGSLIFNANNTLYAPGDISGTGSLTNMISLLILTGNNTYSGITINDGKIQLGDQGTTGSLGTGNVTNNDELIFARTDTYTVNNIIDGLGYLSQVGDHGLLILNGANSFLGGVSIGNSSTIQIGNSSALGTGGVFINVGTLQAGVDGLSISNPFTIFDDATINNNGYNLTLNADIEGSKVSGMLYFTGAGVTTLNASVTDGFRVDGLVATTDLIINGNIYTNGNQSYANPVTLTGPAIFDVSDSGLQSIIFNNAITGGQDLTLQGSGDGTYQFTINGLNANNVNVIADPSSSDNLLTLNTGGTQNFVLTSNNTGIVDSLSNVASFNFSNIHNLNGGSGGQNTLTGANIVNDWTITATNGGSVTNLTSFANMQNLIGGSDRDVFFFNAGSSITGTVDGGDNIDGNNDIDVSSMNTLVLTLSAPTIPNVFDAGVIRSSSSAMIANFTQVQRGIGDGSGYIVVPNIPNIKVTYYDSPTNLYGEIADPFYFNNWIVGSPPTPVPPTPTPTPSPTPSTGIAPIIAPIVNQPLVNADNNGSGGGFVDYSIINRTSTTPLLRGTTLNTGPACYYTNNIR